MTSELRLGNRILHMPFGSGVEFTAVDSLTATTINGNPAEEYRGESINEDALLDFGYIKKRKRFIKNGSEKITVVEDENGRMHYYYHIGRARRVELFFTYQLQNIYFIINNKEL